MANGETRAGTGAHDQSITHDAPGTAEVAEAADAESATEFASNKPMSGKYAKSSRTSPRRVAMCEPLAVFASAVPAANSATAFTGTKWVVGRHVRRMGGKVSHDEVGKISTSSRGDELSWLGTKRVGGLFNKPMSGRTATPAAMVLHELVWTRHGVFFASSPETRRPAVSVSGAAIETSAARCDERTLLEVTNQCSERKCVLVEQTSFCQIQ